MVMRSNDEAARAARADRLREEIEQLLGEEPAIGRETGDAGPVEPPRHAEFLPGECPRDSIHRRMNEIDETGG